MPVRGTRADERGRTTRTTASSASSQPTAPPALLADWQNAVVDAVARELAKAELQPELDAALAEGNGGVLDEQAAADDAFYDANDGRIGQLAQQHAPALARDKDGTAKRAIEAQRARVEKRRDPFGPVAAKEPNARAREVVLWENGKAMVLVDLFSAYPKALVVPKQVVMFPTEAPLGVLDELARLAAQVSDAFVGLGAGEPAKIWINPPQDLTVKQLHVHVMPALGDWRAFLSLPPAQGRRERAFDVMKSAKAQMQRVFQELTKALEANLGPSTI